MREFYYDPTTPMTYEQAIARPQPVCVLVGSDGQTEGVLVQVLDEKFVIEPKDFNDGEEMKWDDAMSALKAEGKTTFGKQQAYLVMFLIDRINAALISIGADELVSGYWDATEYDSHLAWFVHFGSGGFGLYYKCYSIVVRAIRQFS